MRLLWEVSNLFICLILSIFNAVTSVIYVENGTSLILNPNIRGKPEDILWTYNGNKVAEHDLTEFQDYGLFKGRSWIEISSGQLTVRHMTSHDSGIYRSVIQINGNLQNSEKEVQVIDAVQEPNVTCKLNNISKSRTLFCSVSSQFRVSYEWTGSSSSRQSGRELPIGGEEKPDSVYTCTVKNEVSQKSSNFSLKDCDTDEPLSYQNIILLVALPVIAAVIVGIVAVAILCIQQRRNTGEYVIPLHNLTNTSDSPWIQEPNEDQALWNSDDAEEGGGVGYVGSREADRTDNDYESGNESRQRTDSEGGEKINEQEMAGAENMNKYELLERLDARKRSESEKDGDMNEVEQETSEDEELTGPAQVRREEPSSRNTKIA